MVGKDSVLPTQQNNNFTIKKRELKDLIIKSQYICFKQFN